MRKGRRQLNLEAMGCCRGRPARGAMPAPCITLALLSRPALGAGLVRSRVCRAHGLLLLLAQAQQLNLCEQQASRIEQLLILSRGGLVGRLCVSSTLSRGGLLTSWRVGGQAMGRVGEVVGRTWQTAAKMKAQRGPLPEDAAAGNDNFRVRRYVVRRPHGLPSGLTS